MSTITSIAATNHITPLLGSHSYKIQDSPYCNNTLCADNETCCTTDTGLPLCCEHPNATCCGVGNACCPNGYLCDPVAGDCVQQQPSTTCSNCTSIVNWFVSEGCKAGCADVADPTICYFIEKLGLCEEVVNWVLAGHSAEAVCSWLGYCSGGTCTCGYCTRYAYGRCLSFPNHCPANATEPETKRVGVCWNGQCEHGHEGCCMTCF